VNIQIALKLSFIAQRCAKNDAARFVHLKQLGGCPPFGRHSNDNRTFHSKMVAPLVAAGIKQSNQLVGYRIVRAKIRSFEIVASATRITQILKSITAAMLLGSNMFHMEWEQAAEILRQSTVLTTAACSIAHFLSRRIVH